MPKYVDVVEFEATCLELIDEITQSADYVIVTKDGEPYVNLVPRRQADEKPDAVE
jgi:antitoxin (DNA-binding transcriptional repressor) of toxin-antitoxin stability system